MSDRELIARLAHALRVQLDGVNLYSELLAEADARALLAEAQPQPVEPTDDELKLLAADSEFAYEDCGQLYNGIKEGYPITEELLTFARAVIRRWGRPAPEPQEQADG